MRQNAFHIAEGAASWRATEKPERKAADGVHFAKGAASWRATEKLGIEGDWP